MKKSHLALLVISLVLIADQSLKFWVKTNMYMEEQIPVLGNKFELLFVENAGMAFGLSYGGESGKLILSLFRLVAVGFITVYLLRQLRRPLVPRGLIISLALILAGAIGNIIDSAFYGMIFESSSVHHQNVARFMQPGGGYAPFLHGHVVDMLHFDLVSFNVPFWVPIIGGRHVNFFQPVFNLADASITLGVFMILLGHRKYFRRHDPQPTVEPTSDQQNELATETDTPTESVPDSKSDRTSS